ncbi:MAG: hypothetical protein COB09_11125 [Thalassobium sp.]|nr:MAG: hypothetical protein COB09_11125 [Thalassobium sp.]
MKKHPNKEIRAAIEVALAAGWEVVEPGKSAHCYCRLRCGTAEHRDCIFSVWSTPKNPQHHAEMILKKVRRCAPE